jgi:hypothetical protein
LNQIAGASLSCPRDFFCENASIEDSIAQIRRPTFRNDRGSLGEKFGSRTRQPIRVRSRIALPNSNTCATLCRWASLLKWIQRAYSTGTNTKARYASPDTVLDSGISKTLGRHFAKYDLPALEHGQSCQCGHWKSPLHIGRRNRGSRQAIDHNRKPFADDGTAPQVAETDHAALSVTVLRAGAHRAWS